MNSIKNKAFPYRYNAFMYTKQIVPRFDRRTTRNLKANIIFELQYPLLQVGLKKMRFSYNVCSGGGRIPF